MSSLFLIRTIEGIKLISVSTSVLNYIQTNILIKICDSSFSILRQVVCVCCQGCAPIANSYQKNINDDQEFAQDPKMFSKVSKYIPKVSKYLPWSKIVFFQSIKNIFQDLKTFLMVDNYFSESKNIPRYSGSEQYEALISVFAVGYSISCFP